MGLTTVQRYCAARGQPIAAVKAVKIKIVDK